MQTTLLTDSCVTNLVNACPQLQEIGLVIDEDTSCLPIDIIFAEIESLTALHLRFDLPRYLLYDQPSNCSSFLPKQLISVCTYSKLTSLTVHFNHEGLLQAWLNIPCLLQYGVKLRHLEVLRKLTYRTLAHEANKKVQKLEDSDYDPMLKLVPSFDKQTKTLKRGQPMLTNLLSLKIHNYFSVYFLCELVKINKHL